MMQDGSPPAQISDASAAQFNAALRQLHTIAASTCLFRDCIAPLGFDTFACGEVDTVESDRTVFFIIDWPDEWRRFYFDSGLIERDPVVSELKHRSQPFTWSDLRADRKFAQVGRAALDRCAAAGWAEGLVVPLPSGGSRIGLVSLAGHLKLNDAATRDHLALIAQCFYFHVRTLVAQEGFAVPPMGLTSREIAALRLVARGFADNAIAAELGIALSTAHEFVEKAKHRLKTRSRAETVAVATAFGILNI